jgi:tRNA A37 N6-isopentenylltransferase MiaA
LWARAINQKYDFGIIKEEFQTVWQELKKLLEQENLENLQKRYLEMLAGTETQKLNESDFQNPIRLINWILRRTGQEQNWVIKLTYPEFESQQVFAIKTENDKLKSKIKLGIESRIESGLLAEVRDLLPKLGKEKLWNLGLEYRQTMLFLEAELANSGNNEASVVESGTANESEAIWKQNLIQENWQYARRQKIWLAKQDLIWVENLAELLGYL